jgi:NAD(P)-dependent dehydrogenase (short-subunit alcohol dehydrogenase family)
MHDSPVMLVAGGTGSVGRVIAAQALAVGWSVVLHGSSSHSVDSCVTQLRTAGNGPSHPQGVDCANVSEEIGERLFGVAADIQEEGATERLVEQAAAWRNRLDAVIDCISTGPAGVRLSGRFAETEPRGYSSFLNLSVVHLQRLAHAALPWIKQRGGTLIAFASDAGRFAAPGQSVIGASRAAIIGFVRNLALEVARDAVRVHCVSPSFVAGSESAQALSEQSSDRMERAAARAGLGLPTAADIAPLILFLCSEGASKITGQVISVNGGLNA